MKAIVKSKFICKETKIYNAADTVVENLHPARCKELVDAGYVEVMMNKDELHVACEKYGVDTIKKATIENMVDALFSKDFSEEKVDDTKLDDTKLDDNK